MRVDHLELTRPWRRRDARPKPVTLHDRCCEAAGWPDRRAGYGLSCTKPARAKTGRSQSKSARTRGVR